MGLGSEVGSLYLERSGRTIRRVGVVGELVNGNTINLFSIVGGPILCSIFGIITVGFGVTATTVQLLHSVTAQAMGLACTTLSGLGAGIHLNPTGAVGVAIAIGAGTSVGVYQPTNRWSLSIGNVTLLVGGATSAVAAIDWYITFDPAILGASVAAM